MPETLKNLGDIQIKVTDCANKALSIINDHSAAARKLSALKNELAMTTGYLAVLDCSHEAEQDRALTITQLEEALRTLTHTMEKTCKIIISELFANFENLKDGCESLQHLLALCPSDDTTQVAIQMIYEDIEAVCDHIICQHQALSKTLSL